MSQGPLRMPVERTLPCFQSVTGHSRGLTYQGNDCSFEMERKSTLISSNLPYADDGKLSAAWSIKSTNTTTISTAPSDSLTQLEVVGIITVLEDCVDQLVVLGLTGNKPQYEDKTTFKSLEERFGDVPKDESINFQKTKLLDVSKEHTKLDKIHKNRAFLQETVRAALTELETSNTFTCLTDVVNNVTRMKKDEEGLILEGAGKTVELAYLKNQLRREQITRANDIGLREELIAKLKDDLQTQFFQDQMEQEFVNRWESARCEQNAERLDKTVSGLKEQEDLLKHNMDTEMRVHTDTVNFLSQAIQKIEAEQQSWINRYDSEMDEREVELNLLKNKKAEDYKELEDLALVFHHHQTEIDDYLDIKEVKQQTLAHEMLLNRFALLIQDWWRYTMYRKKLGPYKPQKKEKKGDKGKGKKGGKNKKK